MLHKFVHIALCNARGHSFINYVHTFEYIRLNGILIAIDKIQTKKIFSTTRLRVLFRPNRIG